MRVAVYCLPLLPSLGVHKYLEEPEEEKYQDTDISDDGQPLNDEEEVEASPDGQGDVEITVVWVEVNFCKPEHINILALIYLHVLH